ncbi:uncharacterized protein CDAR_263121 [Caerostris darwini]|uniref:Transposase n=1 Tax=Caerostris darwini TaxID=1538125 RepID=A0AAV4RXM1_9ARAC|nr:uncharacterized protein CDAR_263121 [Caerostris darwini]
MKHLIPFATDKTTRQHQFETRMIENLSEWATRQGKVILSDNIAPSHTVKVVRDTISVLGWKLLLHQSYSSDLVFSDYQLFSLMSRALSMKHFNNYEDVEKMAS